MNSEPKQKISFAEFELDAAHRRLLREGKTLPLNAKAFDLLVYLAENAGRVVTKDEILDAVWANQFVEEANLKVQMSALRKALGERRDEHRFLVTIPGKGYKFIGDIRDDERELVIESSSFSRIVIEEEREAEQQRGREKQKNYSLANSTLSPSSIVVGIFIVAVITLLSIYLFNSESSQPFEKIKLTRLTNSGKVSGAAVSPDGKYIAYVLGESEGNSLWIQQIGTASNIRLLPPVEAQVYELTFTPDGSHIFYSLFGSGNSDPQFYRVPSLGGVSEKIQNIKSGRISFAPDGKRFAYAQSHSAAGQNYLMIADADGTNQQTISAKQYPNTFETEVPVVAWSPDGETIACIVLHVEPDASYFSIVGINPRDGSEKLLSRERWYNVFSIEWLKNGSGMLISSSDQVSGSNQVRFLSYPNGEARQITNDLSQYYSLSATADSKSFIGIQTNTSNGIFVGKAGADDGEYEEIVSETGGLNPFVWTPDGRIIFRSNKDGVSNLWTIDADGGNRRQLTTNAQVDGIDMCITPDGRYIVFGSWRSGKSNLWRVDADGGNLTQLTNGKSELFPKCSPDNRTIVYQNSFMTRPTLWKVDVEGGEPTQLTDFYAKWNAISNDNRRISYLFMDNGKWRIGIIPAQGGAMLQALDSPATLNGSLLRWSPDNESLLYISTVGNVGNIRSLPLDGSEPQSITNFKSHHVEGFARSPDGRLAVVRSSSVSDVVLITDEPGQSGN